MGVGLVVEVDTTEAQNELARVGRAVNPTTLLKLIGQRYLNWIDENFKAHGIERPWAPLSPNSRAAPGRQGIDIFPNMRQSFVTFGGVGMKLIGAESVMVGTENRFAAYHHYGVRPHPIRPVSAKALRFWTVSGLTIRREVLNWPGISARPLLPSLPLAEKMAQETVQGYIDRTVALAEQQKGEKGAGS